MHLHMVEIYEEYIVGCAVCVQCTLSTLHQDNKLKKSSDFFFLFRNKITIFTLNDFQCDAIQPKISEKPLCIIRISKHGVDETAKWMKSYI